MSTSIIPTSGLDDFKILINNLKLLDFPFNKYEKEKSNYFTIQSFQKSNINGMTAIIHFLIINVSPDPEISNNFSFCFPATTNKELKDFKETAFNELKNLEKLEIIPVDTLLGKSILDTACGERLISFMRVLSDATLVCKLKSIKGKNFRVQSFECGSNSNSNSNNVSNKKVNNSLLPNQNAGILEMSKKAIIIHTILEKNK